MRQRTVERLEKALQQCADEGLAVLVMGGWVYLCPERIVADGELEQGTGWNPEHPELVLLSVDGLQADGGDW